MGFIDTFTQMYHVLWPYASPYSIFPSPHMSSLPFPRFASTFMQYLLLFSYLQNRGFTSENTDLSHLSQCSPVISIFLKITYSHSSLWMNMYRSTFSKFIFLLMDIYIVTNGGTGVWRCRSTVKERAATFTKECFKMPVAMCFRICVLCGVCEW